MMTTPETDALLADDVFREDRKLAIAMLSDHARKLEQQRDQLKAALEQAYIDMHRMGGHLGAVGNCNASGCVTRRAALAEGK